MTNLIKVLTIIGLLTLSACGGASGGGATAASGGTVNPSDPTGPEINTYQIFVTGTGGDFAADVFTDFGEATTMPYQHETPWMLNGIPAQGLDLTVFGRNLVFQFSNRGSVDVHFTVRKNGVDLQSTTITPGNSPSFHFDI